MESKPIFAISTVTGCYDDIILVFNILAQPPQLLYIHKGIDDHVIHTFNVSPDGRTLYYITDGMPKYKYDKLSIKEQIDCKDYSYLCEYDENYNLLYKDEAPYIEVRHSCWPSCFRYMRPFLGVHINEFPSTINIIYKNLKTNKLKIITYKEFKFTEIIREYRDNGIFLTPEDILGEENANELSLEDDFHDELTTKGCEADFTELAYMHKNINYYHKKLAEDQELANKYQITNDGESVYIYLNFRGRMYKEVLVPPEEY
jgi:hypothetical protein